MYRRLAIYLTLFGPMLAQAASSQELWSDFLEVDSEEFKGYEFNFESFAKNSIYLIDTVSLKSAHDFRVIEVSKNPRPSETSERYVDVDIVAFQVETCRKQQIERCPVFFSSSTGTAFYNSENFYTCRHNVHNWMALASELNDRPIDTISPPLLFRNRHGNVVYNSAQPGHHLLEVAFMERRSEFNDFYGSGPDTELTTRLFSEIDYLEFSMDSFQLTAFTDYKRPVVPDPIEWLYPSMPVVAVGFPGATSFFDGGEGDTSGRSLVASFGYINAVYPPYGTYIRTTALGAPGLSGGPLLTKDGAIIGPICFVNFKDEPDDILETDSIMSYAIAATRPWLQRSWNELELPTTGDWGE
jgi:hypothetical protein